MTSIATSIDAARVELLLNELRLPGVKAIWPKLAASRTGRMARRPLPRSPCRARGSRSYPPSHRATHGGSAFARRRRLVEDRRQSAAVRSARRRQETNSTKR